jgi:hypothetical protein
MKYTIIKWVGTILIIGIGVYAAFNMTYSWKIKELKLFKLSIPESTYQLSDDQKVKLVLSISFKTREEAKAASKDRDALRSALKEAFKGVGSESFSNNDSINELRLKILMDMQKAGFALEQLSFDNPPSLM